ncbi:type IV pili methyl-accepting chemotaxis transducer N-terminal domain-containing protein [Microaerobacter geothermalis]|uniref:diguanylate cyclase domain-containing protein n=1 Tax=Microaerobacter geothermalis TaxID=674972 RepID=UPI001F3BD048|nr:diguanylate cyclase [Microaerobacter geothermalis]MCF6093724.1 type IV pili methyl-accepting chemotaxis transducer N-terminal domain-containing protein [Microaerobacter geothermalis]
MKIKTSLFLFFVVLLILNTGALLITFIHDENMGKKINLAGKQRMLAEEITNQVYQLYLSEPDQIEEQKNEVFTVVRAFDLGLSILETGDIELDISPSRDKEVIAVLKDIRSFWGSYKLKLAEIMNSPLDKEQINHLLNDHNQLISFSNQMVNLLEQEDRQRIETLRWLQGTVLLITIIYILICWVLISRKMSDPIIRLAEYLYDQLSSTDSDSEIKNLLHRLFWSGKKFRELAERDKESNTLTKASFLQGVRELLLQSHLRDESITLCLFNIPSDYEGYEKDFCMVVRSCLRDDDLLGRVDKSRFAILLQKANKKQAEEVMGRILKRIQVYPFTTGSKIKLDNWKVGLSSAPESGVCPERLLAEAERQLNSLESVQTANINIEKAIP